MKTYDQLIAEMEELFSKMTNEEIMLKLASYGMEFDGRIECFCISQEWPGPSFKDCRWPKLEFVCDNCKGKGYL